MRNSTYETGLYTMPELTLKIIFNSIMSFIAWFFAYLDLNVEAMAILAVLVVLDYFTGIVKSYSLNIAITSRKMNRGVLSKISLLVIPIVISLGAKATTVDAHILVNTAINLLILSEIYSIIGNIYAARSGEELPEMDAVAMIGKTIRDFIKRIQSGGPK